ncbi:hypothetical protein ABMB68_008435 [Bradyrhizobium sp. RT4a]
MRGPSTISSTRSKCSRRSQPIPRGSLPSLPSATRTMYCSGRPTRARVRLLPTPSPTALPWHRLRIDLAPANRQSLPARVEPSVRRRASDFSMDAHPDAVRGSLAKLSRRRGQRSVCRSLQVAILPGGAELSCAFVRNVVFTTCRRLTLGQNVRRASCFASNWRAAWACACRRAVGPAFAPLLAKPRAASRFVGIVCHGNVALCGTKVRCDEKLELGDRHGWKHCGWCL